MSNSDQSKVDKISGLRYYRIPIEVVDNPRLGGMAIKLYCYIFDKAYFCKTKYVMISNKELMSKYGKSERTITNSIASLVDEGVIKSKITQKHGCKGTVTTIRKITFLKEPK